MTGHNVGDAEPALFSALITPHRSLGRTGFLVLMSALCAVSFVAGIIFLAVGAWPVIGFLSLDILLICWAFRANYRSAAAYEQVTVTATTLTLRKVSPRGKAREWTLNPLWVKLDRHADEEFGLRHLFLVSHGRSLSVADLLGPEERESFATALAAALGEARRGAPRTGHA